MNDIDIYGNNIVYEELKKYKYKIIENNQFDINDFIDTMEKTFSSYGYRQINKKNEILVIHDCGAGDFILATPAFREIRRIYDNAKITIVVDKGGKQLAEQCPYFDIVYANEHSMDTGDFLNHYNWDSELAHKCLLQHHYDIAFLFSYNSHSNLLAYMSGARRRISSMVGVGVWSILTPQISSKLVEYRPIYSVIDHDVDRFLSVIDSFKGTYITNRNIECWCSYEDEVYVHHMLSKKNIPTESKLFALGIGGTAKRKQYPIEKYIKFLSYLVEKNDNAYFIIIGGINEAENGEKLSKSDLGKHIINVAGYMTWTQTIAIMKHCEMYIGSDTSTLHFAAALKLPVLTINCYPAELGLHNSAIPVKDRPYRVPSVTILPQYAMDECKNNKGHVSGCSRDNEVHCIKQISAETIIKGYELLLNLISMNSTEAKYIC